MYLDIFTDADGEDNTIDTGNTTATFDTDTYKNLSADITEAHGATVNQTTAYTAKQGMKILIGGANTLIVSITKYASSNATKGYILNAAQGVLATGTFVGDVCTFSTPYTASSATSYYICADKDGASYTGAYDDDNANYPIAGTKLSWTKGFNAGSDDANRPFEIISCVVTTVPANTIVQTNTITVDDDVEYYLLYAHNALTGTGAITYDISFDNGSNYETGKSLNTTYVRSEASSSQVIIKINLNGTGASNTASADDYSLIVSY